MTIMKLYRQMSEHQERYIDFIKEYPGCSMADVTRACKSNPNAGHKWVYDGIHRLELQGMVVDKGAVAKSKLFLTETAIKKLNEEFS